MEAGLTPNSALDSFRAVASISDPEDVVLVSNDTVAVPAGNEVHQVDLSTGESHTIASFSGRTTGLAIGPEGMYVCVTGEGLMRINRDGTTETVLSADAAPGAGNLTSVAVHGEELFVVSGSEHVEPEHWARDLFTHGRSGRLYQVKQGSARVLHEGLQWPYGLAVMGDDLIFTESWAHRIMRTPVGGGPLEIMVDKLPAYPGRLSPAPDGGLWLAMFAPRTYMVEFVLREDEFRDEMISTLDEEDWVRPALRTLNSAREPLQLGRARHLGEVKPWAPSRSYGLAALMSPSGEFVKSYHSRADGHHHGTTAAIQAGGRLVVVSAGAELLLSQDLDETEGAQ